MPIIRRTPRRFTIVPNEAIESGLSFEAIGVLTYLLSKPDNWTIRISELRKRGGIGRDKMRRIVRELEEFGLLILKTKRDPKSGRVCGQEYVLFDTPQCVENRTSENPTLGKSATLINTDRLQKTDFKKDSCANEKYADCVSEKSDVARIAEETDLESLHRRLMKVSGQENNPSIGLQSLHEIVSLLSEGLSIEEDIIPAAKEIAKRGKRITSWKYLAAIARDIHAKRECEKKKTKLGNIIEDWEWPYIARIAHAEKRWYWDAWGAPPSLPTTLIPEKYHDLFDGVEEYAISHINPIKERTKERYEWYLRTWEELNGDSNS